MRSPLRALEFERHPHGGAHILHGGVGYLAGGRRSCLQNIPGEARIVLVFFAALLHRLQHLDQCIGSPALALDAADARGSATLIDLGHGFFRAEDLVQIADRAHVGIAGIAAAHARRVGHHRLELLPDHGLRIGEQDGVAVGLRHLAAVGAGKLRRGSQQRLWFGKDGRRLAVELVEAPRDFARQFDVRNLILAHRNKIALVDQDVGRLQHGITEEAVGPQVLLRNVLPLLLVGRNALQPAKRRDHGKQQVQFGMLGHVRLDEHGAALGIESGGQPVEQHLEGILLNLARCRRSRW